MKKSELKTGMIVETREGKKYLVMLNPDCKDRDLIGFGGGFMSLKCYNEDLRLEKGHFKDDFTIDKIYSARHTIAFLFKDTDRMVLELIWERPKPILDKAEKEYLGAVIKPFRESVKNIRKYRQGNGACERIVIEYKDEYWGSENFQLPTFRAVQAYKGMELHKDYTLEELGL